MAKQRKQAQDFILKYIDKIAPGGDNKKLYVDMFEAMNDHDFDVFMQDLASGKKFLVVIAPNLGKTDITVENNLKVAAELGHDFFQRLWIGPKNNQPAYLTPVKYLVMDLPVRRQSQNLIKKISVPDNNRTVDHLTGQPTGASKGAKISYPELQVLAGMELDQSLLELIKFRAGDRGGYNAMNAMILRYGTANIKALSQYSTGVESTKSLKTLLTAMHLKNSL
jgi:hypothetical protein